MANLHSPYHPIIYVRGFAGTQGEIEDTVGDPYMGFNIGSTKSRQVWDGKMRRYYFESPLVRLKDEPIWRATPGGPVLSDARYDDVYVNGEDLTAPHPDDSQRPLRSDITLVLYTPAYSFHCQLYTATYSFPFYAVVMTTTTYVNL